jgi:hypothetical protein
MQSVLISKMFSTAPYFNKKWQEKNNKKHKLQALYACTALA